MRICTFCKKEKLYDDFGKNASSKSGLTSRCKECTRNSLNEKRRCEKRKLERKTNKQNGKTKNRTLIIINGIEHWVLNKTLNCLGQKYNRLTVLNFYNLKNKILYVKCKCDCGNESYPALTAVITGRTQSCGCAIQKYDIKELGLRTVTQFYKSGAKARKLSFSLSLDDMSKLIYDNCHYCGSVPKETTFLKSKREIIMKRNGIDRKNSDLGYDIDNCVTCCYCCNRAKKDMSYFDFCNYLKQLIKKEGKVFEHLGRLRM